MEPMTWVLLAKPVLYWGVFETARTWSADGLRISRWRPVSAALLRTAGGVVLGIPAALLFAQAGESAILIAFSVFRFLLWLLILAMLFDALGLRKQALLAFAATGLNWGVDLLAFGGLWTDFPFRPC